MHVPRAVRIIFTDVVGILLIISSPFLGLIPGPGGIPIFLAGLGMLAIHHKWAKDLLHYFKVRGTRLLDAFFPENRYIMLLYDFLFFLLTGISIVILQKYTGSIASAVAFFLLFLGIGIFASNRKRLQKISSWFKRFSR